ncbi:hypothetical protein NEOLEDRAFT_1059438 [Neolentinus lepideus HHB14362 ss-1]|uniref:SWR1-complex protein 5 n=1 Tax=Neolentinus lepideus HHB14362 ss-1 TaxID=1314782 RepID=A0A165UFL2_9AGAM|nr:hypothetical protein NEOLEDRAFT_1059438 [Neolentinus lepideus HHB14362 ss-1]
MPPLVDHRDSDSEDDADYVPPADDGSSSDDEEQEQKTKIDAERRAAVTEEEKEAQKRDAAWASFQASLSSTAASTSGAHEPSKMVKIEKRYRFAGEDVVEVQEVPEDSDEARKWPRWQPANSQPAPLPPASAPAATSTQSVENSPKPHGPAPAHISESSTAHTSTSPSFSTPSASITPPPTPATSTSRSPARRPGPRKPKTILNSLPSSQKPKKLTTLDKSAMDWQAANAQDQALKDELEANRRGGGYLEKVEFLQRVDERRDAVMEAGRAGKRRKL